jgi:hypothetical protein
MRSFSLVLGSALLALPRFARATEPDTDLAFFTAAALDTAGFIAGSALMATSRTGGSGDAQRSFGWLTIQAGFTLSPIAAHAVVGEWDRGALFAAVPAGALAGTAAFYRSRTDGVEFSTQDSQWLVWGLFTAGLAVSTAAAIDVLFAGRRRHEPTLALRPAIGPGQAGLRIEGEL